MKSQINIEAMRLHRDIALKVIEFVADRAAGNVRYLYEQFKMVIVDTYDKQNWKGLQMTVRDLIEMTESLSLSDYNHLNGILHKEFGKTIVDLKTNTQKKIKAIIKRGEINTTDEYRMIQSRIDEICGDKKKAAELEVLKQLLSDIHSSNKKLED